MGVEHASVAMMIFLFGSLAGLIVILYWKHDVLTLRRIKGIDVIAYAVSRAAEQGRPVVFSTGITGLGPVLYACLGVLKAVAKKAALFRSKLLVPQNTPETLVMVEDAVRDAYASVQREDDFDPSGIAFLSEDQFAFASGYMGLLHRENAGTAFLFGSFAAESLIMAEAGRLVGAYQVGASVSPEQVPFFICTCDYSLIGEELFAASAYLSDDVIQKGVLRAQDQIKFFLMALILVGSLIETARGFDLIKNLPTLQSIISWGGS